MSETKIVYKDGNNFKAVVGEILKEDNFFIFLKAINSGIEFRIGKSTIVSVKTMHGAV